MNAFRIGRRLGAASALAAALAFQAAPAAADIPNPYSVTFDAGDISNPVVITFDGLVDGSVLDGLGAQLTLTLLSISGSTYTFDFDMFNPTDGSIWDTARITGFGFDIDPNAISATLTSDDFKFTGAGNYPDNGLEDHAVELCFTNNKNGNCAGSKGGVEIGGSGDGIFALTFASPPTDVTLSGFIVRYQGLASDQYPGIGSATGIPVPGIPEPATWAMMIIGFAAVGSQMRRRRRQVAVSFA